MNIGTTITWLIDFWHCAVDDEKINKPIAWSLYQVWKIADRKEKPRKALKEQNNRHWLDNADSWICPVCGFETNCPSKYEGCKCPQCGFQDEKDIKSN